MFDHTRSRAGSNEEFWRFLNQKIAFPAPMQRAVVLITLYFDPFIQMITLAAGATSSRVYSNKRNAEVKERLRKQLRQCHDFL